MTGLLVLYKVVVIDSNLNRAKNNYETIDTNKRRIKILLFIKVNNNNNNPMNGIMGWEESMIRYTNDRWGLGIRWELW